MGETSNYLLMFNSALFDLRRDGDMGLPISILGRGEGEGTESSERRERGRESWFSLWEYGPHGSTTVTGPVL